MVQAKDSCVKPARGPIKSPPDESRASPVFQKEVAMVTAKVGKEAPDFEASAFIDGGFRNVILSEFKGKWVVVCFYPGDFTFV